MTNEMLTQIESYPGVLIPSTNLMDDLDPAAMRRFNLKIKFGYLRNDAAWALLEKQCEAFGLPHAPSSLRHDLGRLDFLTPGDFAAVARRHQFNPLRMRPISWRLSSRSAH